ncbi:MAG: hypothetical protein U0838_11270 [Chloroflexota bacterium]
MDAIAEHTPVEALDERTTVMWLVARREIIERRPRPRPSSRLVFTLGLLMMAFVLPMLTRGDDTRHAVTT